MKKSIIILSLLLPVVMAAQERSLLPLMPPASSTSSGITVYGDESDYRMTRPQVQFLGSEIVTEASTDSSVVIMYMGPRVYNNYDGGLWMKSPMFKFTDGLYANTSNYMTTVGLDTKSTPSRFNWGSLTWVWDVMLSVSSPETSTYTVYLYSQEDNLDSTIFQSLVDQINNEILDNFCIDGKCFFPFDPVYLPEEEAIVVKLYSEDDTLTEGWSEGKFPAHGSSSFASVQGKAYGTSAFATSIGRAFGEYSSAFGRATALDRYETAVGQFNSTVPLGYGQTKAFTVGCGSPGDLKDGFVVTSAGDIAGNPRFNGQATIGAGDSVRVFMGDIFPTASVAVTYIGKHTVTAGETNVGAGVYDGQHLTIYGVAGRKVSYVMVRQGVGQ